MTEATTAKPVWYCGKCDKPSLGLKWTCQHCGAGAGGVSEGHVTEVAGGVAIVYDEANDGASDNLPVV